MLKCSFKKNLLQILHWIFFAQEITLILTKVMVNIHIYYINSLVCACVLHLWPLDAQTTWREKEKWRWAQRKMTGKKWDNCRMRCVRLFESWNPGLETEVLKPRSWGPGPEIEVRRAVQGFFSRPFSTDCLGFFFRALFRRTAQG